MAEILNNYFIDAVQNLDIKKFYGTEEETNEIELSPEEKINQILNRYESHPSVVMIKSNVTVSQKFNFDDIDKMRCTTKLSH